MNIEKIKESLTKIATRGWVDNALDPQWAGMIARSALAELEKPAEDDVLQLASRWVLSSMDTESLAYDIQQYAESYHAKNCAECKNLCARAKEHCEDREPPHA